VHFLALLLHLLAAMVWVGGTVALVFAAVPAIRVLEGRERVPLLRKLGRRWRPLGYGSLAVLLLTGLVLAHEHYAFSREALFESTFGLVLVVKSALVVLLVAASLTHDYVLGPRLQHEMREGLPQRTRPRLIAVGWVSFALTVVIPVLGLWLTAEAHGF
jgi:putative copper export protein